VEVAHLEEADIEPTEWHTTEHNLDFVVHASQLSVSSYRCSIGKRVTISFFDDVEVSKESVQKLHRKPSGILMEEHWFLKDHSQCDPSKKGQHC